MDQFVNTLARALIAVLSIGSGPYGLALVPETAGTQAGMEGRLATLEAGLVKNTVDILTGRVELEYFDPAMGAKVAARLREALDQGRYAKVPDLEALASLVTADMYAVAKDRHLSLVVAKAHPPQPSPAPALREETREERGKRENFGFQKIEILPGNVGYLRVTAFYRPEESRETIAEAMAFLSHANALIVDLRDHGGGSSPTVALFTSYFLDTPEMPLFLMTRRPPEAPSLYLTEPGTLPYRNGSRPTYLLTSARTRSGGEAIAFMLQERHRAVVVGEGTWGGANQVPNPRQVTQGFLAYIPNGQMGSSLTGKNWEGVGVIPDVPVIADRALQVAQALAIQALLGSAPEGQRAEILP